MQERLITHTLPLETQLLERYGPLLTQQQLAQLLDRSPGGLRYSLRYSRDPKIRALQKCGRPVGRRIYYPIAEVAAIISSVER